MRKEATTPVKTDAIKSLMIRRIRRAAAAAPGNGKPAPIRVEMETEPLDPLPWLARAPHDVKIHFSGRDANDPQISGVGEAAGLFIQDAPHYPDIFHRLHTLLNPAFPEMRLYGGFAFAPGHDAPEWRGFGMGRFVIPRFEIRRVGRSTQFACHLPARADAPLLQSIERELANMEFRASAALEPPAPVLSRADLPPRETWLANLERILQEIQSGKYEKTVIARKVDIELERPANPFDWLHYLKTLTAPRYHFLFQFEPGTAFVGSSPERLYKRRGRFVYSEAVAGTRVRGQQEQEDDSLARELLNSPKEQREHDFVAHAVESRLRGLCLSLDAEKHKSLLKLREGHHIVSRVTGFLRPETGDAQLTGALHPTPAVCGCPAEAALDAIRAAEPFKRGWYAGLIGAVGADDADFAVAIRSALIQHSRLSLYSGVGVVDGSIPEQEWLEAEAKLKNFLDRLPAP